MKKVVQKKLLNLPSSLDDEKYLRDIIEKLPGSTIFWKNTEGQFLGCNELMAKIYGVPSPRQIIGKKNSDFLNPRIVEQLDKIDKQVLQNSQPLTFEEININDKGQEVYFLTTKRPFFDENNQVIGLLGTSVDITALKEAERQLRESNEKISKLNELKNEFINNMQHDLRTPLSSLYTIMDVLRREEHEPERAELFKLGFLAAEELLGILDEFVNFSKYDANDFALTERKFDLENLVSSVIKLEALGLKQKGLELRFNFDENCPKTIISDEYRIRGVLINILSNAIKFTEKGFIEVEVKLTKKLNEREGILFFRVKDTGRGIARKDQQGIFEKFKKLSASNTGSYRGMGVGLYLVRRFLNELAGELYLTSEIDKGTEFSWAVPVRIPLV